MTGVKASTRSMHSALTRRPKGRFLPQRAAVATLNRRANVSFGGAADFFSPTGVQSQGQPRQWAPWFFERRVSKLI
jgi:hypothetical protein